MNRCVVGVSPGIAGMGQDDGANSVDHLGLNSLEPSMCFQKKCVAHIDAFNVARWVPYPARSKRSGAALGAPSTDEVGPTKSRKGPKPEPRDRRLRFLTKERSMATLIKQIYLSTEDYGPNKGVLRGTIKFANSRGEIQVNIDPQKIERIVAVLAEELVDTARETARLTVLPICARSQHRRTCTTHPACRTTLAGIEALHGPRKSTDGKPKSRSTRKE